MLISYNGTELLSSDTLFQPMRIDPGDLLEDADGDGEVRACIGDGYSTKSYQTVRYQSFGPIEYNIMFL